MLTRMPRKGSVSVLVVGALIAILGMCALSVDMGMVTLARQQLQVAADAAALSAATTLRLGMNQQAAIDAAISVAADHHCLRQPVVIDPASDIQVGVWNSATSQVDDWFESSAGEVAAQGGTLAVRVTARRTAASAAGAIPMYFARAIGITAVDVQTSAIGALEIRRYERPPVEAVVLQDFSGSFSGEFAQARTATSEFVRVFGDAAKADDQIGYAGFSDDVIGPGVYPEAGWAEDPAFSAYGAWRPAAGLLARNYPQALTDIDNSSGLNAVKDRFSGTSTITYFGCGSHRDPERRQSTGAYYTNCTNSAAALRYAVDMFLDGSGAFSNPAAEHVVVLLSDGMPFYHDPSRPQGYRDRYNLWVPAKEEAWSKAQTILAADYLGSKGIRLHTVTLCQDSGGTNYGYSGSDAEFNSSIVQNGGYAFLTPDAAELTDLMIGVASIEVGQATLLR
jgi:hypothetical protein